MSVVVVLIFGNEFLIGSIFQNRFLVIGRALLNVSVLKNGLREFEFFFLLNSCLVTLLCLNITIEKGCGNPVYVSWRK